MEMRLKPSAYLGAILWKMLERKAETSEEHATASLVTCSERGAEHMADVCELFAYCISI
jgi:hypothetical protein